MDHYSTLGVSKNATPEEIKKAYRKLASVHHPDKGGDTATFQNIQAAYEILSDPAKRQQHDNPAPQGFGNFGHGQSPFGFGGGVDINDLFQQMFRQTQQPQRPQTQTYRTTVWVTLDQVFTGDEHLIKLQTPTISHAIKVNIPKGIYDGGHVRIDNAVDGATLIVEFRIHKHLKYDRNGNDLVCNHSISVLDLIVGTTFEFVTLSGKTLEIAVKPMTQPHVHLKIAGQGMPINGTEMYGDQIILLKPVIPDTIDVSIINSITQSKTQGN